jgi:hypothetical protein
MNAELQLTQKRFLQLFAEQRAALAGQPRQFLNDLQHEAAGLRQHETFSVRVSAEINYAACTLLLEK